MALALDPQALEKLEPGARDAQDIWILMNAAQLYLAREECRTRKAEAGESRLTAMLQELKSQYRAGIYFSKNRLMFDSLVADLPASELPLEIRLMRERLLKVAEAERNEARRRSKLKRRL